MSGNEVYGMLNESYIDYVMKSFPKINPVMQDEKLLQMHRVCSVQPAEMYVRKSERLDTLRKELEVAKELLPELERAVQKCAKVFGDKLNIYWPKTAMCYKRFFYARHYDAFMAAFQQSPASDYEQVAGAWMQNVEQLRNEFRDTKEELARLIEIETKGAVGENKVETYLKRNLSGHILSNVVLPGVQDDPKAPRTAETDMLIICNAGVYVCEIKNYGKAGQMLEVLPDGEMVKKDFRGNVLEYMGSPFKQNSRHMMAVRQVLRDTCYWDVPICPVVVIADTDVQIVNNSNYMVMTMQQLKDAINNGLGADICTAEQQEAIRQAVERKQLAERKFPIIAVSPVADQVRQAVAVLESGCAGVSQWKQNTEQCLNNWYDWACAVWEYSNPDDLWCRTSQKMYRRVTESRCRLGVIATWIFLFVYLLAGAQVPVSALIIPLWLVVFLGSAIGMTVFNNFPETREDNRAVDYYVPEERKAQRKINRGARIFNIITALLLPLFILFCM